MADSRPWPYLKQWLKRLHEQASAGGSIMPHTLFSAITSPAFSRLSSFLQPNSASACTSSHPWSSLKCTLKLRPELNVLGQTGQVSWIPARRAVGSQEVLEVRLKSSFFVVVDQVVPQTGAGQTKETTHLTLEADDRLRPLFGGGQHWGAGQAELQRVRDGHRARFGRGESCCRGEQGRRCPCWVDDQCWLCFALSYLVGVDERGWLRQDGKRVFYFG